MIGETSTKLAVLLHADVIGSTALVQIDETLAHARLQDVFRRFSEVIAGHGGSTHEIRGDAMVAEFSRASDALSAAVAFQSANGEYNEGLNDEIRPQLRIGIAMGEVVIADNTVTGGGIVLAQRLEQLAPPGGVCIQGAAYETLPKRLPFEYENLGEQQLKGFDEPVRVYSVKARGEAERPASAPGDAPAPRELELPSKPSIAVLPFNNISNDSEQEFFADGISEDIITELSKFRTFFVIARNSSFAFKNESFTVKDIGLKLGVRYVVEGSVRRAGNRVRISAQLIDAIEDKHIWAERYDRELEDIFAVQDEVTQAIVTAIAPQLSTSEQQRARRKPTENLDAWECYQRGLWYMFSYVHTEQALHYFHRAIELDSEFDSAYAGLAYTYAIQILIGKSVDKKADLQRGLDAANTALRIDQTNPFSYFAIGRISIFSGNHDKAIAEYKRAISLNPNYALAHFGLAHGLWHAGRPAEALPHYDDAIRLSPHDPIMWAVLASKAIALVMDERYEEGIAISRQAQQLNDSQLFTYLAEVSGLGMLGQAQEAENALQRLRLVEPEISMEFIERSLPMTDSEAKDRFLRGLKLAGVT
ncbi:MAG: adenylate/guanylate cyclase domain-containing protein [Gammaproteobacteria bacterium]|nr:MAG: adenylate/guanylate cyclase domain-containing protein [Gammaproteobacteria bacterium]UCH41393.1 MAG: adenylate/guanylate cyclase domain-containing protein [Gammaproteobacteria bacterium]